MKLQIIVHKFFKCDGKLNPFTTRWQYHRIKPNFVKIFKFFKFSENFWRHKFASQYVFSTTCLPPLKGYLLSKGNLIFSFIFFIVVLLFFPTFSIIFILRSVNAWIFMFACKIAKKNPYTHNSNCSWFFFKNFLAFLFLPNEFSNISRLTEEKKA